MHRQIIDGQIIPVRSAWDISAMGCDRRDRGYRSLPGAKGQARRGDGTLLLVSTIYIEKYT